jgi:DnaJ-domain-containing protein 1
MSEKHPAWTRKRVGRNRVHWVAYDDRADSPDRRIVDQGYATTLPEADAAAKSALADAGMYQARRLSTGFGNSQPRAREKAPKATRPAARVQSRPREYLYTRLHSDEDDGPLIAAHLVIKKTPRRVYVTRKSVGPDQIGSDDENWTADEKTIALDRARLERDGSVYSSTHRHSDFYTSRAAATGESDSTGPDALAVLKLRAPCSLEEIKDAYRARAKEAHPDRGGTPADFQAVEAAYRRLLREAQAAEG